MTHGGITGISARKAAVLKKKNRVVVESIKYTVFPRKEGAQQLILPQKESSRNQVSDHSYTLRFFYKKFLKTSASDFLNLG